MYKFCECGEKLYYKTNLFMVIFGRKIKNPVLHFHNEISLKIKCRKCGKEYKIPIKAVDEQGEL